MISKRVNTIIALVFIFSQLSGQVVDTSLFIHSKLLSTTTFAYFEKADSFSKNGDSIDAGIFFLKVDPYFLMANEQTPASLDTFFTNFILASSVKEDYKRLFTEIYDLPGTEAYRTFEKMYHEDQNIRYKLEKCGDSITYSIYERKMIHTDSIHFDYLYNYVNKYGWPDFKNGSLFAQLIAVHDHAKYDYYIPIMRKAALEGKVSAQYYNVMISYKKNENHNSTVYVQKLLALKNKSVFDVSSMISETIPDSSAIRKIQESIKEHCPIKYQGYIFESMNVKDRDIWYRNVAYSGNNIISKMTDLIWAEKCHPPDGITFIYHLKKPGKMRIEFIIIY